MNPTSNQIMLANEFDVPRSQAHTISAEKVKKFIEWYWSPAGRVERALDYICIQNMLKRQREWM